MQLVEVLEEQELICTTCQKDAHFRRFIIRDTKPYKVMNVHTCQWCGITQTTEEDLEILDYGVRVTATLCHDDLKRMVYTNTCANTYFYSIAEDGKDNLILSFNCDRGHIDCIEGIITRGQEALNISANPELKDVFDGLGGLVEAEKFKVVKVNAVITAGCDEDIVYGTEM